MGCEMNTRKIERSILHHTNRQRREANLKPLKSNRSLIRAARRHSRWMARKDKLSHDGAGGSTPSRRARESGYYAPVSENIRQCGSARRRIFSWRSTRRLGEAAVIDWMNSPGHRKNLLDPDAKVIGIGVARNRKGSIYLTQNFGHADDRDLLLDKIAIAASMFLVVGILVLLM